jgi:hypothetical protein
MDWDAGAPAKHFTTWAGVAEDLWPMQDIALPMDRCVAFTTLLSALAGAAWWAAGRALRAIWRYGGDALSAENAAVAGSG